MAWLSGYSKRKPLVLTGGASGAQTDFQLKLIAAHAAAMQSDFDDLRFTQADGTTLIDAWLETKVDDSSATIWAEFPTTPANTVTEDYYMYYGNVAAASNWDIAATFIVGDDGESGIPSADWVQDGTGSIVIENSIVKSGSHSLKIDTGGTSASGMYMALSSLANCVMEYDIRVPATAASTGGGVYDGSAEVGTNFFYRDAQDEFQYYDTNYHSITAAAINTWYKIELVVKSTSVYDIYIDGTLKQADANTRGSPADYNRATFGGYHINAITYIDNFRTRKYAANPPTYAFGSEESAPTTGNPYWYYEMLKRRNN